jgi:hypothetical protein
MSSVSGLPNHVNTTYGQEKGTRSNGIYSFYAHGQILAVEQSWEHKFSGNAAQALWRHIVKHYNSPHSRIYAHYTAIVQSSGMGKLRMVDELGKEHFVIPINLRGPHSTGAVYPLFVSMSVT